MLTSTLGLTFIAFLVVAGVLRPILRRVGWDMPDGPVATGSFNVPIIGGMALWCAIFIAWLFRPAGVELPLIVLGLIALRLLATMGSQPHGWAKAVLPAVDLIVCSALVQRLDGSATDLRAWTAIVAGVALLQGTYRLRSLDGLATVVLGVALAAVAALTAGAAQWLASAGAAASAGLLLLNLPLRANRRWRIQSGQGGSALLALTLFAAALLAGAGQDGATIGILQLLWLLPLPLCELLRLALGRQPSHQRLLDAGFSVTALFLLYALMSLLPTLVVVVLPDRSHEAALLGVLAALMLLWFVVLWQAPRLMWMLPWRLRRIDVEHKDSPPAP